MCGHPVEQIRQLLRLSNSTKKVKWRHLYTDSCTNVTGSCKRKQGITHVKCRCLCPLGKNSTGKVFPEPFIGTEQIKGGFRGLAGTVAWQTYRGKIMANADGRKVALITGINGQVGLLFTFVRFSSLWRVVKRIFCL